jgi:hypothetical protein
LLLQRGKQIEGLMKESQKTLLEVERSLGQTLSYLKDQWNFQRQMQLGAMENETELQMKKTSRRACYVGGSTPGNTVS